MSLQQEPSQEDVLAMNFTFACLKVSLQLLRFNAQLPHSMQDRFCVVSISAPVLP